MHSKYPVNYGEVDDGYGDVTSWLTIQQWLSSSPVQCRPLTQHPTAPKALQGLALLSPLGTFLGTRHHATPPTPVPPMLCTCRSSLHRLAGPLVSVLASGPPWKVPPPCSRVPWPTCPGPLELSTVSPPSGSLPSLPVGLGVPPLCVHSTSHVLFVAIIHGQYPFPNLLLCLLPSSSSPSTSPSVPPTGPSFPPGQNSN